MDSSFQALADPRRRQIVALLRGGPLSVGDLVERLPIAQSGVSRHLRILREAGFVEVQADGQRRFYALRPEPFEALDAWLAGYRAVWEERMDRLGAELERRVPQAQDGSPPEKL